MTRRLLIILASISILSSCGFALRGNVVLSDSLNTIALVGEDHAIMNRLDRSLSRNDVNVVDEGTDDAAEIRFTQSLYEREVRTTDANGLATAYNLRYIIDYKVVSSEGEPLQINQHLKQTRVFEYDPAEQLQADEEERFLREEMEEEIVLQLMRRLGKIR